MLVTELGRMRRASYATGMDEMLDIVNEHDEVIGQTSRGEAHARGLMHRAVHIMLSNSDGQYFLQRRSLTKDTNPGLWDSSAAGHVDAGEQYLQSAVRELEEELGVSVEPHQLTEIGRLLPSENNGYEFVRVYCVHSDAAVTIEPSEIDEGKWVDVDTLNEWLKNKPAQFASSFPAVWHNVAEFGYPDKT